jgi:hypothetical protein
MVTNLGLAVATGGWGPLWPDPLVAPTNTFVR